MLTDKRQELRPYIVRIKLANGGARALACFATDAGHAAEHAERSEDRRRTIVAEPASAQKLHLFLSPH